MLWKISDWHPKIEFSWLEVKQLSSFSIYVFAAQSVNQLIKQADTLIVGKLFSPATLGFYSRANSLNSLINKNSVSSIAKVFFPALASIQDKDERFEAIFLKVISLVSVLSVFLTGFFFIAGEELVIGLFGAKWEPSVFIFKIIIINGFTYPISAMIVNAFMAKGKSKQNFHYGNIRKVIQLTPMIFAFLYGFNAFLYATVASNILAWILNNIFVHISLKISLKDQFKVVLPNLLVVVVLLFIIEYWLNIDRNLINTILKLLGYTAIYLLYLKISGNIILDEMNTIVNKIRLKLNQ